MITTLEQLPGSRLSSIPEAIANSLQRDIRRALGKHGVICMMAAGAPCTLSCGTMTRRQSVSAWLPSLSYSSHEHGFVLSTPNKPILASIGTADSLTHPFLHQTGGEEGDFYVHQGRFDRNFCPHALPCGLSFVHWLKEIQISREGWCAGPGTWLIPV